MFRIRTKMSRIRKAGYHIVNSWDAILLDFNAGRFELRLDMVPSDTHISESA
jgi:hypothetical protein